jgi:hypothetical protein
VGGHSYEVSQGFQPVPYRVTGLGEGAVEAAARALLGEPVTYVCQFGDLPSWCGPPGSFLSF